MGVITKIEEKLGEIIEKPFRGGKGIDPLSIEIALKKQIEQKRRSLLGKTAIPNRYSIILDQPVYEEHQPFFDEMRSTLLMALTEWIREKGYEMYEEMALEFRKGRLSGNPFNLHVSYVKTGSGRQEIPSELKTVAVKDADTYNQRIIGKLTDKQTGNRYAIYSSGVVIGRGMSCDFRLQYPSVSEKHARISYNFGKVRIEDLGSSNGTRVNRMKISNKIISNGDIITLGNVELIYGCL